MRLESMMLGAKLSIGRCAVRGSAQSASAIRPCEGACIHIEKAVETYARIAFAYGTYKAKSPARAGREGLAMQPWAATVGRAVIGLAAVLAGRNALASAPGGYAAHSDIGLLTMLRCLRGRAGVRISIRTIGP
jgi:hypothetical protein